MGKKRVLVADDEPDILAVIKAILEHEGFVVHTARDGQQAFKLLRKHAFSAVILDVYMDKVNGIKLLQMMRRSSKLKNTPAMLITGNLLRAKRLEEDGSAKLANAILTKPFNTRDLIKQVRALVNSKSAESEQPSAESKPVRK
jgi:DNA-binding response OmpR family regulator